MAEIKNRIIGSGIEPLDSILFNPRNWRIHPLSQQDALKGVLEEVGWVQQVIVNKRTGNLIDGHLRCQLAAREGAQSIPVVYADVRGHEEAVVLAPGEVLSAQEVQAHVAARLAAYKVPQQVHVRHDSLPRNPAGKMLKTVLKREYASA